MKLLQNGDRPKVELDEQDLAQITVEAFEKSEWSLAHPEYPDKFPLRKSQGNVYELDRFGRCCEWSASFVTGIPVNHYNGGFFTADLGENYQVRGSPNPYSGLILRPHKPHWGHFYILVVGRFPIFIVQGWATAEEIAKTGDYVTDKGEPYFFQLHYSKLHPIATLPKPQ